MSEGNGAYNNRILHGMLFVRKNVYHPLLLVTRHRPAKKVFRGLDIAGSDAESILCFTVHKCASTFLGRLLRDLARTSAYIHVDFDSFFALRQQPVVKAFEDRSFVQRAFHPNGYIYGPMRSFRNIPDIGRYKILLVLRDPRDVLVSYYYSMLKSHGLLSEGIIRQRREAASQTIDQFVLNKAREVFAERYEEYARACQAAENILFFRYEDMIYAPNKFLERLENYTQIRLPEKRRKQILKRELRCMPKERKSRHRRSGRAGDFREKLKPETVEKLNHIYSFPIRVFGFANAGEGLRLPRGS